MPDARCLISWNRCVRVCMWGVGMMVCTCEGVGMRVYM